MEKNILLQQESPVCFQDQDLRLYGLPGALGWTWEILRGVRFGHFIRHNVFLYFQ